MCCQLRFFSLSTVQRRAKIFPASTGVDVPQWHLIQLDKMISRGLVLPQLFHGAMILRYSKMTSTKSTLKRYWRCTGRMPESACNTHLIYILYHKNFLWILKIKNILAMITYWSRNLLFPVESCSYWSHTHIAFSHPIQDEYSFIVNEHLVHTERNSFSWKESKSPISENSAALHQGGGSWRLKVCEAVRGAGPTYSIFGLSMLSKELLDKA